MTAPADIRALAEAALAHEEPGGDCSFRCDGCAKMDAIVEARGLAPDTAIEVDIELARFALAVLDALDEAQRGTYWRDHAAVEAIRAAIARNMEARRGG